MNPAEVEAIRAKHEQIPADPEYVRAGGPEMVCPFCGDSCETIALLDALAASEAALQEAREALRELREAARPVLDAYVAWRERGMAHAAAKLDRWTEALSQADRALAALDSGHQEGE